MPGHTYEVNYNGLLYILEAINKCQLPTKVWHASTSEMFGHVVETEEFKALLNMETPFAP